VAERAVRRAIITAVARIAIVLLAIVVLLEILRVAGVG
jgi:hypothetical protein